MNLERLEQALLRCDFARSVERKDWPRMRMVGLRMDSRALIWASREKLARSRKRLEHRAVGLSL